MMSNIPHDCTVSQGFYMLVKRGGCSFTEKILAAAAAGARGVVVVNTDASTTPMSGNVQLVLDEFELHIQV